MARFSSPQARAIGVELRERLRCPTCKKCLVVVNRAGHGQQFVGEAVTVDSHCTCVGGPAHHLVGNHPDGVTRCGFCGADEVTLDVRGACRECA